MPFFLFHQTQLGRINVLPCHTLSYTQYPNRQAKPSWSLHVFVQSCSMCLSWLLNVFFRDVSWMPNKTKLKFDHDKASAVELIWLCIVCGFGLDISSLCGNSQSFPLALDTVSMPGSVVPMAMFAQTIWWWNEQHIKLWEGKSNSAVWTISGMKLHLMLLNYKISIYEISNE